MPHLLSFGAYWTPARAWVAAHKIWSTIIVLVLIGGGWIAYGRLTSTAGETRYVLGTVSSSTIIASISGSGQVSPSDQVDIKPKASGEIVSVLVQEGQQVSTGQALAYVDSTTAQKSVRDAKANLESAQIALAKLQAPATPLSLTQAQNALQNAQDALSKLYNDSQTDVVNAFLDLPNILTALQNITTGTNTNTNTQWNIDYYLNAAISHDIRARTYRDTAYNDYVASKKSYDTAFADYQTQRDSSDPATIEKLLSETYTTVQLASKATKSINAFIQFYEDTLTAHNNTPSSVADTALVDLNTYTGTLNTHLSTLLNDTTTLKSDKQTITEKQQSLEETQAGTDALDLQSAQLNVTKAQNTLSDAQTTLADYTIRAPFTGTIATLSLNRGDEASPSTAAATLITKNQIASLSLNEVDAAKVAVGQKATLTFDAIDGLSIAGTVASVDTLGVVSQGVVSYTVKIEFSTQDTRVKPGMTVNASIITDTAQNALSVPSSAVKTMNEQSYVQVFQPALPAEALAQEGTQGVLTKQTPVNVPVVTGISDDTNIQILSGLSLGEQIILRTTTGTASSATTGTTRTGGGTGAARGAAGGPVFLSR